MASSSFVSSVISFEFETSREMTPEFDPIAAYCYRHNSGGPERWVEEQNGLERWS
jgi:hypothetical protein